MKYIKYFFVLLLNYVPLLFGYLFYEAGFAVVLSFISMQLLLTMLNHRTAQRIGGLIFLNLNLLLVTFVANKITNILYYNNVSADSGTLAVGSLSLMGDMIYVVILFSVSFILKLRAIQGDK